MDRNPKVYPVESVYLTFIISYKAFNIFSSNYYRILICVSVTWETKEDGTIFGSYTSDIFMCESISIKSRKSS